MAIGRGISSVFRRPQPRMTMTEATTIKRVALRVVHIMVSASTGKRQVLPLTDHFEKLLEMTCPNHTYLVKHKLKDCGMMKNFMASGSLT
jgi:hypothetical protein